MSLPASEERVLTGIEQALVSRDPRLKSLFAIFTRLTWHEAMPAIEQIRSRRLRLPGRMRLPAGAVIAAVIVLLVGAIVLGSLGSPRTCGAARPPASAATRLSAGATGSLAPECSARLASDPRPGR